jgi:hypothetical protein
LVLVFENQLNDLTSKSDRLKSRLNLLKIQNDLIQEEIKRMQRIANNLSIQYTDAVDNNKKRSLLAKNDDIEKELNRTIHLYEIERFLILI